MSILFNPTGGAIRSDFVGDGHFGARRGKRIHAGIDLICVPGQPVFSPIAGTVSRFAYPYVGEPEWKGILIRGRKYDVKMFYLSPTIEKDDEVTRGQVIGTAQDISIKYPGCTPHVHLEVYVLAGRALDIQGRWTETPFKIDPAPMVGIYE
jgi:murein DD-endopeptidase MepM/ murein hydrolase activator NlpD